MRHSFLLVLLAAAASLALFVGALAFFVEAFGGGRGAALFALGVLVATVEMVRSTEEAPDGQPSADRNHRDNASINPRGRIEHHGKS